MYGGDRARKINLVEYGFRLPAAMDNRPLKFFFNDGYTTEDGEEMSVREIRKILKECIDNEDKKKPLTDDELTELLKEKGYPIARRTVAKYRQQMNIPVARLRR